MKTINLVLLLILFSTACNNNRSAGFSDNSAPVYENYGTKELVMEGESPSTGDIPENIESVIKKIIKDGRMGIKVKDIDKAKESVNESVKTHGGYYANESFYNSDYESVYNLVIRIPAKNFEKFIAEIESGDNEILNKEIDARDVTTEFIDLETRLENKRNYLKRYKELLSQSKTISDILEIEERIRGLQEEIESTEGQLKYLNDQVAHSTLNLTITKTKSYKFSTADRDSFFERLKFSLSRGWYGFVDFTLFVIKLWPFWIILFLLLPIIKKIRRKRRERI
jgi:uncharacterized small protein (DUF1192 family)